MCDLSEGEREAILDHVAGLEELVARIRDSARSIEDRSWMEHADLDDLLRDLAGKANEAQRWVEHKVGAAHH